jgi:hypothetical protein
MPAESDVGQDGTDRAAIVGNALPRGETLDILGQVGDEPVIGAVQRLMSDGRQTPEWRRYQTLSGADTRGFSEYF